jgi:Tol biopolymer transport system component
MLRPRLAGAALFAAALAPFGLAHAQALPGSPTIAYASLAGVHPNLFIADADGANERTLLAPNDYDNYNASFSQSGDWVVFTSNRSGSADVYRVHPDGSGLERLTDHPAFDDQGVLSPDGASLAFVSTRDGRANIWLLDMRRKTLLNLTENSSGDFRPAWSPDGTQIAFSSDRDSPHTPMSTPGAAPFFFPLRTQVYVMARDGTQLRRLTNAAVSAGGPSWSVDGTKIVYYEASSVGAQIFSIDVATGAREALSDNAAAKSAPRWVAGAGVMWASQGPFFFPNGMPGQPPVGIERATGAPGARGAFRSPSWSADGKRLVFDRDMGAWPPLGYAWSRDSRYRVLRTGIFPSFSPRGDRLVENNGWAGAAHNSIVLVSPNGSSSVLFDDPMRNALAPKWSPHGDLVAFAIGEFLQTLAGRENVTSHLATIPATGGAIEELPAAGEHAGFPSWSPDQTKLVYADFSREQRGLRILDLKAQRATQLTTGPDTFPAWSPLGDRIVFTSNRDGDYEIYTVRPNGKGLTRLTHSPGNDAHPAWSPDGEWIVFASNRTGFKDETGGMSDGEIFVMSADGSEVRQLTENTFEDGTPAWRPPPPPPPPPTRAQRKAEREEDRR